MIELQLTLIILVGLFGGGIVLWGSWVAITGFYDHCLGHYKRIQNTRIDAAHVTGQFHSPTFSQRDFK
jgi:hypothetical protein